MESFDHLANDELLLIFEEKRNKRQALARRRKHYFVPHLTPRQLLDLDGEMSLISAEYQLRTGVVLEMAHSQP